MPTFAEIAHWSADEVNAQILTLLPKGWAFDLQTHPDHWRASFRSEAGVELWGEEHYEVRLLLFSAFGWLWQRLNPAKTHPAWVAHPSRPLVAVRPTPSVPDPEDLSPEHIRAVYAADARKRGKET